MKKSTKLILTTLLASIILAGCTSIGANPSAPSQLEQTVFNIQTNFVPITVFKTNQVTTVIDLPVYVTNSVGIMVTTTNHYTNSVAEISTTTNQVPAYNYTTGTGTTLVTQTAGGILNTFFPGVGSMASSGILALLALWGHLRSTKSTNTATSLAQEVETIREFIQTLPNGAAYDNALVQFLQQHQMETGVAEQVLSLLAKEVSNPDAKVAVTEIQQTLTTLAQSTTTTTPPAPAPATAKV